MTQPSDMGMTPDQMLAAARAYSAQDASTPPPIDPAAGIPHVPVAQPSAGQYFAAQPMAAPPVPAVIQYPSSGAAPPSTPAPSAMGGIAFAPPASGGARPAGWQPTTKSVDQTTSPFTGASNDAALGELGARQDQRIAQGEFDSQNAQAADQAAKILGVYDAADSASERLRKQHELIAAKDSAQKIQNVIQDASTDKVDPMKWFNKDMNTGQKILFALGSALQGFGYGYTGRGVNPQEVINQQIKGSVASQQAAHENKLNQIGQMKSAYGIMKDQFGDAESAAHALELAQRQSVITQLNAGIADSTKPQAGRLVAANLRQGLLADQANTMSRLENEQSNQIKIKSDARFNPMVPAGTGPVRVQVDLGGGRLSQPMTLDDAKKARDLLGLGPEAIKAVAEGRKMNAEATIAEAKADGAKGESPAMKTFKETAQGVTSTAWDPTRWVQGTDAYAKQLAAKDVNAQMITTFHATHPGISLRGKEMIDETLGAYMIHPDDTPSTVQLKLEKFIASQGGGSAATDMGSSFEEK